MNREKFAKILVRCIAVECVLLVAVVLIYVTVKNRGRNSGELDSSTGIHNTEQEENGQAGQDVLEEASKKDETTDVTEEDLQMSEEELQAKVEEEQALEQRRQLIASADQLAFGYDYDAAIEKITSYEGYEQIEEMANAVVRYEEEKKSLVPYGAFEGIDEISHVFFHSLIADTKKAFDGDYMSNGYNYWMTTVDEFNRMLEQMYESGYVLVSIHDIAHEEVQADGSTKMVAGEILLPEDKKPFVLSQDDVNFYEYMQKDGFAKRIVIDENGYPACEIVQDGVTSVARDYDVVPILEKFIEEHPDFSYRGARGIIGVTGYEGVMGYRTNETDSETYDEDLKQAIETANRLKEIGWEFASHSYGHGHMGQKSADYVASDSKHWDSAIASIVGDTDIYLFPYGEDIQEGVGNYSGEKYETLYSYGFRYFCGVYAYPWIQVKDAYVRMTRRNLDGFTMHFHPERLEDLFDVETTIDEARPEFK